MGMVSVMMTAEIVAVDDDLPCLGSLKQMQLQWVAKFRHCMELLTTQHYPREEATCSQMTRIGCRGHGIVLNWAHQLSLNPAFRKSYTSCNHQETRSSWNMVVISNTASWIFAMVYTYISKIMHSAVCWVFVITSLQALLSQQLSTGVHASIHGCHAMFPTPLSQMVRTQ